MTMKKESFELLLEKLELPKGATDDDALLAVDKMRHALTAATGGDDISDDARAAMIAAHSRLSHLTGEATIAGAVRVVESRFAILAEREKELEREKTERRALEMAEYRELTGELVKLGAELPSTAWEDKHGTVPCERILNEPLPRLRDRVARLKAASGGSRLVPIRENVSVTEAERDELERRNIDPVAYQRMREQIAARSNHTKAEA